jgi:hypothetical protein
MAYILNGTTIKNPVDFKRDLFEVSGVQTTLNGRTVKDLRSRKEVYTLEFQHLSSAERNAILAIYDLQTTVSFQVTETNLTIAETQVHMDIPGREYLKGGDYLESFTLILTEVV